MELIDRVAFMKDLAERTEANKDLFKNESQYLQVVMVMNGFFQDLKEFPTVEVESRRTGVWVGIDQYPHEEWECDNCGNIINADTQDEIEEHKYCHKCGAKMSSSWADMEGEK